MRPVDDSEFFEEDEPIEKIAAAFARAKKGRTTRPNRGLYERVADQPDGLTLLASARLRRRSLVVLHKALKESGSTRKDVAEKLGVRLSRASRAFDGDGDMRLGTLAEYLQAMGFELDIRLVPAGDPRRAALEGQDL